MVVTPPSGFEVSTTIGSGYGSTVSLTPTTGTVANTTVYLRLAAATAANTYSGNVVLSSTGAIAQNVATVSSTVSSAPLTITADNKTKVYGAVLPTFTAVYSGFVNGDTQSSLTTAPTLSTTATAASHVSGSPYPITASGAVAANYNITYAAGNLTVTSVPLTITANNVNKSYGAILPTLTASYNGFVNGDAQSSLATAPTLATTVTTMSSVAGSPYIITASSAVDADYNISYVPGTFTITPSAVTITADTKTKTYGQADPALTYQVTTGTLAGNDAFIGSLTRVAGEDAGTYAITQGTLALSGNYVLTFTGANLTIGKAAITVVADAQTKTYGQADPALTYKITAGTLAGSNAFSGSLTRVAGEDAGTYAITQGTLALSGNYALTFTGANLTIGKAAITVVADAQTKTYGQADPALTYKITAGSLAGSDAVSGSLTRVAGEDAGTYAITQGTLALSGNYALTFTGANLTIGKATITIAADAQTKNYGQADPALTYKITAGTLGSSGAFSGSLTRVAGENAGTYAITQGTLALNGNYTLFFTGANLTINLTSSVLSFGTLPVQTYGNADFAAGATSSGGEQPVYTSSNTNVATIVNGNIHIAGAGNAIITASAPANSKYPATLPVSQLLIIYKANQSISFAAIPDQLSGNKYDLSAVTSSSGLPVTLTTSDATIAMITGKSIQLLAVGTASITAQAPGNGNYNDASTASRSFKINNTFMDEIVVRQAVSPNGDGVNDNLYIEAIKDHPKNNVVLVNSSGVKVFELSNYDNAGRSFDGHSNITGAMLKAGTYFYLIEINDGGALHRKTGFIVIKY